MSKIQLVCFLNIGLIVRLSISIGLENWPQEDTSGPDQETILILDSADDSSNGPQVNMGYLEGKLHLGIGRKKEKEPNRVFQIGLDAAAHVVDLYF